MSNWATAIWCVIAVILLLLLFGCTEHSMQSDHRREQLTACERDNGSGHKDCEHLR